MPVAVCRSHPPDPARLPLRRRGGTGPGNLQETTDEISAYSVRDRGRLRRAVARRSGGGPKRGQRPQERQGGREGRRRSGEGRLLRGEEALQDVERQRP